MVEVILFPKRVIQFEGLDVTEQVIFFRNFLNAVWPQLDLLMAGHDWDDKGELKGDWLQVNWECFVEREIFGNEDGSLAPFCVGYLNGSILSRVRGPLYSIVASSKNKVEPVYDLLTDTIISDLSSTRLISFSTLRNGIYDLCPPFDLAELYHDGKKKMYAVRLHQLRFVLQKYTMPGCK